MTDPAGNQYSDLSLHQQFKLQALKSQISCMSIEQAQKYVIDVTALMMRKDNLVADLLKNKL